MINFWRKYIVCKILYYSIQVFKILNYFRSLYGKAFTHLIRLSGIIHCYNHTFKFLIEHRQNLVTPKFKEFLETSKKDFHGGLIELKTVEMSQSLLDYFNKNKIILAGYKFSNEELLNEDLIVLVKSYISVRTQNIMQHQMIGKFEFLNYNLNRLKS